MQRFCRISDPVAAVEAAYEALESLDGNPVFISVVPKEAALARARVLREAAPADYPLRGVPFAVKDNMDVVGMATTAGCPEFAYMPERTATAAQKLLDAGAILVGKTNLDQFATGLVGTRSPYGACRNAFDARYISGGSSSGSALAVAKGVCAFSLGTDTAGSGRVPAAFNGIVGLKPTRGRISAAGVVPACRSLDCVSIFAGSVADALRVLDIAQGIDREDAYSRGPLDAALPFDGSRIAVPRAPEFFGDREYQALFERTIELIRSTGGSLVEIDFTPFLEVQALLYDGPWIAERTAALEDFLDRSPQSVYPVTREILRQGKKYSAVDAFRGQYRLAALRKTCDEIWKRAAVLMVPGAPTIYTIEEVQANPLELNARLGRYTNFANLLDLAAITVPAGKRRDGLPFGVTMLAPAFTDRALAGVAARFMTLGDAGVLRSLT